MHHTKACAVGNSIGRHNGIGLNLSLVVTGLKVELALGSLLDTKKKTIINQFACMISNNHKLKGKRTNQKSNHNPQNKHHAKLIRFKAS